MEEHIVIPDAPLPASEVKLTPFDAVMPPVYTRVVLLYAPKGPAPDASKLGKALADAAKTVLQREAPTLFGRLREKGGLHVVPSSDGVPVRFGARSDVSFASIAAAKFAHSATPAGLVPDSPFPAPGGPLVVLHAVVLADGGTSLGFTVHHRLTDGAGGFALLRRIADECRGLLGGEAGNTAEPVVDDRSLLDKALAGKMPAKPGEHPEYKLPSPAPPAAAAGSTPPALPPFSTKILRFSASSLAQLKADATATLSAGDTPWISTNDALVALFWRAATHARSLAADQAVRLGMAFNGRVACGLPATWLPCLNIYATASLCAGDLVTLPLGDDAAAVRKAVALAATGASHAASALAFLRASPDPATVLPGFNSFLGPDFAVTRWAGLGLEDIDAFGVGLPAAVRVPPANWDGLLILVPAPGEPVGLDAYFGALDAGWEALRGQAGEELRKYCDVVG
ncbi:transferase [Hyaloraphidium curvatum]|nr:transferase [Hyaloraphidium curvatum]